MKKYIFFGQYGTKDSAPTAQVDEVLTVVDFLSKDGNVNYGLGRALNDLSALGVYPSTKGIDLMVLAALVYAADTRLSRQATSQDSWTREIKLIVPVTEPEKWNVASIEIKRALDFLTGDIWTIHFRAKPTQLTINSLNQTTPLIRPAFNSLSLFSGGLDSLIGAIDMLENGKTPLLISHVSDGSTSDAQKICFEELKHTYPNNQFNRLRVWMSFPGDLVKDIDIEKTTRGRSFLFFSIGIFAGTGFNQPFKLQIPENGLIALNVPLDPLRLGSHSTHTTHPFYVNQWNKILKVLGIEGEIENPYWNKTKGEMVRECQNQILLQKLYPKSVSCSSPTKSRWSGSSVKHCGYCLPCLIRRASIEAGYGQGQDKTNYTISNLYAQVFNTLKPEGHQIRSFQFGIERLEKNPRLAKFLIYNSGPLSQETAESRSELADVYKRGMSEVQVLLKGVLAKPK